MASPTTTHWIAVKRILKYLKGTLTHGLLLQSSPSVALQGYYDANWSSCPDDSQSTSGYRLFLGPNLILWSSSKQEIISRSSVESKYRSLATLTTEIIWV